MIHTFHVCFDNTLKHFRITGKQLSDVTGISQPHISEFRRGKTNPPCDTLERLLAGVEEIQPGARRHFCLLLAGGSTDLVQLSIDNLSSADLARLLNAIGERVQQKSLSSHLISA